MLELRSEGKALHSIEMNPKFRPLKADLTLAVPQRLFLNNLVIASRDNTMPYHFVSAYRQTQLPVHFIAVELEAHTTVQLPRP